LLPALLELAELLELLFDLDLDLDLDRDLDFFRFPFDFFLFLRLWWRRWRRLLDF
jgi:hypothetical protein